MKLLIEEYGMLVVACITGITFLAIFRMLTVANGNLAQLYDQNVAWNEYFKGIIEHSTQDTGDFLEMVYPDAIISSSDRLYGIARAGDLKELTEKMPDLIASNPDNYTIPDGVDVLNKQGWIDLIGLQCTKGTDITVLVEEFTPVSSMTAPDPNTQYFYHSFADDSYHEYTGAESFKNTTLYELIVEYDNWGNKIPIDGVQQISYINSAGEQSFIENDSGVSMKFDVAYAVTNRFTQDEIEAGVPIDHSVSHKYRVRYRTEHEGLKCEYTGLFINRVSDMDTDDIDETLDMLLDSVYGSR